MAIDNNESKEQLIYNILIKNCDYKFTLIADNIYVLLNSNLDNKYLIIIGLIQINRNLISVYGKGNLQPMNDVANFIDNLNILNSDIDVCLAKNYALEITYDQLKEKDNVNKY
jgi:hypothetical protein